MIPAPVDTAPADSKTATGADPSAPAAQHDPLDGVVPLGQHKILTAPGVTVSLRRWRYRGQPRVDLVVIGVPTDQAGAPLRDQLLRLRAQVLSRFITRGMYVFSTERNHDPGQPRMTVIDRLK